MKHFSLFDFDSLELATIRTNKKITYYDVSAAFDIETTSTTENGEKRANMYIWMLSINYGEPVYYGRTWNELIAFLDTLAFKLELSESVRLPIYIHNLGYEFQFMRKYFTWHDVFSLSERKPLRATSINGYEFRCSYLLSGFNLENVANNLQHYPVKKLVGDLDYSLPRHHKTPLTKREMDYCKNDILVVCSYIQEQKEIYGDITKLPMTNTGRVRTHVRNECYYTHKSHKKTSRGKYHRYRNIMMDLTLTPSLYPQMKRAFMGGFTHANALYMGEVVENVTSIDFASSYPAVMISEKFPMSRFKPIELKSESELNNLCAKYAVIFDIHFKGIKQKFIHDAYLSESKCFGLVNPTVNNGRIVSADSLKTTITETDFDIIKRVYSWESISVANVTYAHKNYLPRAIVKSVLDLYQDKTVLKGVKGKEVEYMLSKGMLNSIYGMCVTDIVKDDAKYNNADGWTSEPANLDEKIDTYNTSKTRFLYYPWGVWITAYARRNLWTGIMAMADDYIYSDTDSIKVKNYDDHKPYIEHYNRTILEKMKAVCTHHKLDPELLSPKNKQGETQVIGVWDFDGFYTRFKTLGAKRYLVEENGKLELTVAGLSKRDGLNYMLEKCNNNHDAVFEMFNDNLYIPAERTGKNTHTYLDEPNTFTLTDHLGKTELVETLSGVHLESCEFTLSISRQYLKLINDLKHGYLPKGDTYA